MALKSSRRLVLSVLVGVGLTAPSCAQWLGLDELDFSKDDGPLDAHDASTNGGRGGEETEQSGQGGATDGGARQRPADCAVAASLSCGAELACEQPCGGVLWPDGVIPFRVDTEVPSTLADRLEAIAAAWSSDRSASAAVRFARCRMPDCSEQTRFLTISLGSAVSLSPPRSSGQQSLTVPSDITDERIAHELGHVLGLPDIWRRPDRDRFLRLSESAYCGDSNHTDSSRCWQGEFDGTSQPSHRPTGFFGAFDAESAMNLAGSDVCEASDPDPARQVPTANDRAAAIELYRTPQGWSPFLPLGRDTGSQKPLEYSLAAGVAVTEDLALASMTSPQVHVFAHGSDDNIYWKVQGWANGRYIEWGDWESRGCCFDSAPAAVSWSYKRMHLFARHRLGGISWQTFAGNKNSWSEWTDIGQPMVGAASGPAVTAWGQDRLDVFVRGGDDLLYWTSYSGSWSPWTRLGNGPIENTPAVASVAEGSIDVVVAAPDHSIRQLSYRDGHWESAYRVLEGNVRGGTSPALAASAHRLHLYLSAPENRHLLERTSINDVWGSWRDLGGVLQGSPATVGSATRTHVDVAGVVTEGAAAGVWLRSWPYVRPCFLAGKGCGTCAEPCAGPCVTPSAAVSSPSFYRDSKGEDVWTFRGADDHLYRMSGLAPPSDLMALMPLAGFASGSASTFIRSDGLDSFIYRTPNDEVWEIWREEGAWSTGNLTQYAGSVPLVGASAAYVRSDNVTAVVFRDRNAHVRELSLVHKVGWYENDLTVLAQAPAAAGAPKPLVRADLVSSLLYRGADGHLHEIYLRQGCCWTAAKVSEPAGAAQAAGDPSAFVRSDERNAIVYRTGTNDIYELSASSSSHSWTPINLTATTGAPKPADDPQGYVRGDGVDAVVYATADGSIYELSRTDTTWRATNLSALTKAPAAADRPTPYVRADGTSAVAYLAMDGRLIELWLHDDVWRQRTMLAPP